jgi:hypothetical protein
MNTRHSRSLQPVRPILVLLLLFTLFVLLAGTPALAAPPANDDFDNATVIGELTYQTSINTLTATTAADDPSCFGNGASVWYAFTPAEDMRIEADTYYSYYDTTLSVYTGERGSLTQIACNDDVAGSYYYSAVAFDATAGETYYFMVAAYGSGTGGSAYLNVYHVPWPPANDTIEAATPINVPFSGEIDTTGATASPDDPVCIGSYDTVWYVFTASDTGYLHATVADNEYSKALSAYSGTPGALTSLGCSYVGYSTILRFPVTAGETVYLMVSNLYNYPGETMTLTIEAGPSPPANDDFDDATLVPTLAYTDTVDTTYATRAADDPGCEGSTGTVWYTYTPASDTRLDVAAVTTDYFPVEMSVYTGERGSLTQLFCTYGWDGAHYRFPVTAGETYYFMVGIPWSNAGRSITFNLQEAPPLPPNDDFDNATIIASLPYTSTMYPYEATTAADDPATCNDYGISATVWYTYTPLDDQWLQADTFGSDYETTVAVYTGTRDARTMVACAAWNGDQPLYFPVAAGETYYVMIGTPYGPGTNLTLHLAEAPPPPANDLISGATVVTSLPYTDTLDTSTATSVDDPYVCSEPVATVWYKLIPSRDMRVLADGNGSDYSVVITFFTGTPDALNGLNCSYDQVEQDLEGGETYYIMVGGPWWTTPHGGSLVFHLQEIDGPPPNDDADDATTVSALPFSETVDFTHATTEYGDPAACDVVSKNVWYAYTPAHTTWLEADTYGSLFDYRLVAAYTGEPGNLTLVGCLNEWSVGERLRIRAEAGTTYTFMVATTQWIWTGGEQLTFNLDEQPYLFLPFLTGD